jgi:hypothetical protein
MDTYEGDNEDPQSLHKYTYCHSDGVNRSDPTGNFGPLAGVIIYGGLTILLNQTADWYHYKNTEGKAAPDGFAYEFYAKENFLIYIHYGKTICTGPSGVSKFKSDLSDVRKHGWKIAYLWIYGHGDGRGSVGQSNAKGTEGASIQYVPTHSFRWPNLIYGGDLKDMLKGIVTPDMVVRLEYCYSLDGVNGVPIFRDVAPKAEIWGVHGQHNGAGNYGQIQGLEKAQ